MADPSLATFPIVTWRHFEVFDWLFPTAFVNQDADPYLYEVYRRVGRAKILDDCRVINERGGPGSCATATSPPRYDRVTVPGWKDRFLDPNARTLALHPAVSPVVTIDVVIPTFRVPVDHLRKVIACPVPSNADVKFIIIVDNPASPNVGNLRQLQGSNVRIRENERNEGAPRARNRGLAESCAEWVLFLDDDVVLTPECLRAYVDRIADGDDRYAGFIGTTKLPETQNILHEATRMSDITFFFDLPPWMGDRVPWGVTANLMIKRTSEIKMHPVPISSFLHFYLPRLPLFF